MIISRRRFSHMPRRDCFIKWGMTATTAVILVCLTICLYWVAIDREKPIEGLKGDVVLSQQQIDLSWVVVVRWTATLKRRCPGVSKRWIYGYFRIPLTDIPFPAEEKSNEIGSEITWQVPVHVPSYFSSTGVSSGDYRAVFLYACNPMQERIFPITYEAPIIKLDLPVSDPPVAPGAPPTSSGPTLLP